MAYYSCSILTGATTAGAPHAVLRTGASRAILRFIKVFNRAATANEVSFGYKGAGTTTPTTSQLFTPHDSRTPASLENVDTTWSAPPVIPPTFFDRVTVANVSATGIIFSYQKDGPIIIDPNTSLALFNTSAATGGIMSITFEIEI